ncbi:hypothetical protein [Enterococcus rivorum]|uniref:hypothetical protein n=1 Tax=Enterococcus rivorum TaxID=762845 RepID=UPI0036329E6E
MKKTMTLITVMLLAFHSLPVISYAYAAEQEETILSTSTIEESTETTTSSSELLTEQSTEKVLKAYQKQPLKVATL